ncbi:o-succinylbenzoate synthase [Snuella lapsa]|uniref:O-succinylbenzoate synthase n=1 Tax=Snuella lapsa TaxID=870481 RepID=A0ABP6Y5I7_9FLAO
MITASYKKYILHFKQASGTSRGILKTKETWFIILNYNGKQGIGECGLFRGLSVDDRPDYEEKLKWVCHNINSNLDYLLNELIEYPSIQFGLEMALRSLESQDTFELFPSNFTKGKEAIPINGLIWMGDKSFMKQQIENKIASGFNCIKMKIGAIAFQNELDLIKSIRDSFSSKEIEIRVDANGAFSASGALEKLKQLSELDLHSIEQPIKQGQVEEMAILCEATPLPIALDEELIGVFSVTNKQELLQTINPQYIILKPSLIGGFKGSDEWIAIAEENKIGWWITSALESNVGLNAIAQYTYTKQSKLPQGLGTGGLFTNNFESPLQVKKGTLRCDNLKKWNFNL